MKNLRQTRKSSRRNISRRATADLLRLVLHHLMSPQGEAHPRFTRVNLEGSNAGSTMIIRRAGDSKGSTDGCNISIYVNNNIQGVNNSILVGSRVVMGDPGVEFSLGEALRRTKQDKEAKMDSTWGQWRFVWLLFSISIAVLLFSLA